VWCSQAAHREPCMRTPPSHHHMAQYHMPRGETKKRSGRHHVTCTPPWEEGGGATLAGRRAGRNLPITAGSYVSRPSQRCLDTCDARLSLLPPPNM
jgi:hypothetical protein